MENDESQQSSERSDRGEHSGPLVGIGASAGGLEALRQFFLAMPADTGLAFVLILHLDPNHDSLMAELLAKCTSMPVAQIEDGMRVAADHVYVIPPNHYLSIRAGVLHLEPPTERRGMRMPIDHFLRSLAEALAEKAICAILSGTGSDGTLGLREIKGHGGMTLVQEPNTAQYNGMPYSALATGMVDYRLPVEAMPAVLLRYVRHPYVRGELLPSVASREPQDLLNAIVALVHVRSGHDFRHYKQGTLGRRIARRMGLSCIETLHDYLELLRLSDDEVHKLVRDLLISVTSFFREPPAFEVVLNSVAPALVEQAAADEVLRVWVPGCATGEEAYSLAMVFLDAIRHSGRSLGLQVFATDVDSEALDVARAGIYPLAAAAELPAAFVSQFFSRNGEQISVSKAVREVVVFAAQNLIRDPPFSRLDFISCRNLLIYLDAQVQARIIRLFHFALRSGGYLFLGSAETIGPRTDLFRTLSKKGRIYVRQDTPGETHGVDDYPIVRDAPSLMPPLGGRIRSGLSRRLGERVEEWLLREYAPVAVLVDRSGEALYFHGNTSPYLEMPSGTATHDIVALAREGLRTVLRATLQKAAREHLAIETRAVTLQSARDTRRVRLKVWPLDETEGSLLVCFHDEPAPAPAPAARAGDEGLVNQLEYELKATREDLQTTIEEVESANEELKASNEEVMSMNEELQSTNEELETSKEELQSLNEELSTVNNQLLEKVHELEAANNDLANLLSSTDIATIFLDLELRVRRYTPTATRMFALIEADHGRLIADVAQRFRNGPLVELCQRVLRELKPFQEEVCASDQRWYTLRILPYRTSDMRIDGLVLTFSDITEQRSACAEAESRARQLRIIADAMPALIAHIDLEHRFRFVNAAYERWFELPQQSLLGEPLCTVFGTAAYQHLCPQLEASRSGHVVTARTRLNHCRLGEREVSVTWVPERGASGAVEGFYSLISDITAQQDAERRLFAADVVFRSTTEAAAILDEHGLFSTINPAFEALTGYSQRQSLGENWIFLLSDHQACERSGVDWEAIIASGGWHGELKLRRKNGEAFAAWLTIDAIRPGDDDVRGYVLVFADISTVKEAERRLEYLAHHDPLTGLYNRVMFLERVAHALARAQRQKHITALLYLDLDGFKHVNDSCGHELGDRLLVIAAQRLSDCVRAEDTLARLGGDEFGVLLEEIGEPYGASTVADKIIEAMRTPFVIDQHELVLGVSVGISLFPADGQEAATLIRNADTAMYRAKERGGNVTHFYTPALTESVQQRVSTESALRHALEHDDLLLYFQPQMALGSQRFVGVEALLRWRVSGRGVLGPETFLPVAELSGLIIRVGNRVIEMACAQLAAWRAAGIGAPRLSLHVSARQCMDEDFAGVLAQALQRHGVPASALDLEITESCFLDKRSSLRVLPALHRLGVSLTLDDFGTGYASLAALRDSPLSAIKIDRAFVDELGGKSDHGAIARTVIALGRSQHLRVIAEGVETQKQLAALRSMGCDVGQGFLIAPPMPADEFTLWLQEQHERIEAVE